MFWLTWPASMQIYWNKRKRLHKKRVQLPWDWFRSISLTFFFFFFILPVFRYSPVPLINLATCQHKISSKSIEIIHKSPQVMESKTVWDSGFHALDSGFQILDSRFLVRGSWVMDSQLQSLVDSGFLELYSVFQNPGFPIPQTRISWILDSTSKIFLDSGIQIPLDRAT